HPRVPLRHPLGRARGALGGEPDPTGRREVPAPRPRRSGAHDRGVVPVGSGERRARAAAERATARRRRAAPSRHGVTAWTSAAAAAAALALLASLIAGPTVGLVAGLLFAVHPVHVEATASVVGRAELVAAVGYAVALISALRSERRVIWLAGVGLGAALAIGA